MPMSSAVHRECRNRTMIVLLSEIPILAWSECALGRHPPGPGGGGVTGLASTGRGGGSVSTGGDVISSVGGIGGTVSLPPAPPPPVSRVEVGSWPPSSRPNFGGH